MASDPKLAFTEASRFFTDVARQVPAGAWTGPGLGTWTLLELVAHGNRAHTTVLEYLDHPVEAAGPAYFTDDAIAERGRRAVSDLGDDPVAGVERASRAAVDRVQASAADAEVGTPLGRLPLLDYLPSRTAELLVHGLDVARAALLAEVHPPELALSACVDFLGGRAVREGSGVAVVLALTGREALPSGFTIY